MDDAFYKSGEWRDLRYRALKKTNGSCQCCGNRGDTTNPLHVDHIKPRSKFPHLALVLDNLQVLCKNCNLGKGSKDATDWRFVPSKPLSILNEIEPAHRFKLQQLGWLRLNGDSDRIKREADKEYKKLFAACEREWLEARATQ